MIAGRVVDVFGRYVKVRTSSGEKVLKMKGKKLPERGWILEFRREDPSSPFVGSVILESIDPLPPLQEIVPIVEETGSSEVFDVVFLANLTRFVFKRLGFLPKWYYEMLGDYYRKGERNGGIFSHVTSKVLGIKRGKVDRLKAFGDWLNTFSHPFGFRSYADGPRPTRVFLKKPTTTIRIDHVSREYGRILIEGMIGKTEARLKVVPERPIDPKKLEELKKRLEGILGRAFVVQGGKGLGYYV